MTKAGDASGAVPRAAHRRGARVQPLLHAADRRAPRAPARELLLADRRARALRAGACRKARSAPTASVLAHGLGARCRLSEPDPARLRAARPGAQDSVRCRRAAEAARALRPGRRVFARSMRARGPRSAAMLARIPAPAQTRLVERCTASASCSASGSAKRAAAPYLLRPHRPGDIGWVVHRHGALYAQEYGYDERFEALVARHRRASSCERFDPKRERCWIAERDGEIVGSVFLVRKSRTRRQAAPAARRAAGARARHRPAAGRRVHALRARAPAIARSRSGRRAISTPRAISTRRPASAASSEEPPRELRQGARRRDLGAGAVARSVRPQPAEGPAR